MSICNYVVIQNPDGSRVLGERTDPKATKLLDLIQNRLGDDRFKELLNRLELRDSATDYTKLKRLYEQQAHEIGGMPTFDLSEATALEFVANQEELDRVWSSFDEAVFDREEEGSIDWTGVAIVSTVSMIIPFAIHTLMSSVMGPGVS